MQARVDEQKSSRRDWHKDELMNFNGWSKYRPKYAYNNGSNEWIVKKKVVYFRVENKTNDLNNYFGASVHYSE